MFLFKDPVVFWLILLVPLIVFFDRRRRSGSSFLFLSSTQHLFLLQSAINLCCFFSMRIVLQGFSAFQEGDVLEGFEVVYHEQEL